MTWLTKAYNDGPDWRSIRDRINVAVVAESLLGPPHKRAGGRLLWRCPFHDERTPSFAVDSTRPTWTCFGCKEHGDAADLVEKIEHLTFPASARRAAEIAGESLAETSTVRPTPKILSMPKERPPTLDPDEAARIVSDASERIWGAAGREGLDYLVEERGLTEETIRAARLGWCQGVKLKTQDGRPYTASGVVVPWFDGERLAMVKIRRMGDAKPKYIEAYRSLPKAFPSLAKVRPGHPLVVVEGEFDALLLDQEIGEHAAVITIGSASNSLTPDLLRALLPAAPWFLASDNDGAGDRFAESWPARAKRVKPHTDIKDWTDLHSTGWNRIRYQWMGVLGIRAPWEKLESQRWGCEISEESELSPEDLGCEA
jgi:DNA primase